jgi:cobalt/nickel transport protein
MDEKRTSTYVLAGIVLALIIAVFISPFASSYPDGLEKVAENLGFIDKAEGIVSENYFIIPDYSFGAVGSEFWQTAIAGFFGVLVILVIFGAVYFIYRAVNKSKS